MEFGSEKLRPVLLRCLNQKQILILREISKSTGETATTLLSRLSKESSLPLSTLKLNLKKLKTLDLVLHEDSKPIRLTPSGKLILRVVGDRND